MQSRDKSTESYCFMYCIWDPPFFLLLNRALRVEGVGGNKLRIGIKEGVDLKDQLTDLLCLIQEQDTSEP